MKKSMQQLHAQRGVTLVELLVAMVVGLFIVGGVVTVMTDSKDAYLTEQELAFIQENARFALDELGYEIRMAGYTGCSTTGEMTNTLNDTSAESWMFRNVGIRGYVKGESTGLNSHFDDVIDGSDIIIVGRGERDDSVTIVDHNPNSAVIGLNNEHDYERGDILMVATPGCGNIAIFQMSGKPNTTGSNKKLNHNTGNGDPGNCSKALSDSDGKGFDCSDAKSNGLELPAGSSIMRFVTQAYYLKNSDLTGLPTLYKRELTTSSSSATTTEQELVSGIEHFTALYGVDTTDVKDGVIDRYYTADDISAEEGSAGNSWLGWDRVMAVRLTMVVRSVREVLPEAVSLDLGVGTLPTDRHMRQKITSTIRLRNRSWSSDE